MNKLKLEGWVLGLLVMMLERFDSMIITQALLNMLKGVTITMGW